MYIALKQIISHPYRLFSRTVKQNARIEDFYIGKQSEKGIKKEDE